MVYLPMLRYAYQGPAGYVLVSEILYNPDGLDQDQEWVELTNPTPYAADLSGWMLGDAVNTTDFEALYLFPVGAFLGAGDRMVVAINGARFFAEYNFYPDFELQSVTPEVPDMIRHPGWGTGVLQLGNAGDELLLLNAAAWPVDVVAWGVGRYPGVVSHPGLLPDGHSLERYPAWRDTDDCSQDFRDWPYPNPGWLPPLSVIVGHVGGGPYLVRVR